MGARPIAIAASIAACLLALAMAGCSAPSNDSPDTPTDIVKPNAAAAIPASLAPFGEGYPNAGDPCRRLGESAATAQYLDDSAVLVGCPTPAAAAALTGGIVVGAIDGVQVVAIGPRS